MNEIEKWFDEFGRIVPDKGESMTSQEANFRCLQGVSYIIDKMVNVGYRDLLGIGKEKENVQENKSSWCDIEELCMRHPELIKSKVISRKWRLENHFPCVGEYKCRQRYYEPDVNRWIEERMKKKC